MNDKIQAPGIIIFPEGLHSISVGCYGGQPPTIQTRQMFSSPLPVTFLQIVTFCCYFLVMWQVGEKTAMSALGQPINILESQYYFLDLPCIFLWIFMIKCSLQLIIQQVTDWDSEQPKDWFCRVRGELKIGVYEKTCPWKFDLRGMNSICESTMSFIISINQEILRLLNWGGRICRIHG